MRRRLTWLSVMTADIGARCLALSRHVRKFYEKRRNPMTTQSVCSRCHARVRSVIGAIAVLALACSASAQSVNVTVLATGLNGPRGLKFGPDRALYVAEAGQGGSNPSASLDCEQVPGPVGPYYGGPTARISKVSMDGHVTTVVDGLPSGMNSTPTGDTLGVADVAFVGRTLFALLAGGGCSHGNPETPNGVIKVDLEHGTWKYVADLSTFLQALPIVNPESFQGDFEPDGSWYGMVEVRGDLYATEPNHEQIVRISPTTGKVERIADVSTESSTTWIGPAGITYHDDLFCGNLFFGNLAPFPIVPGSANVYSLTPRGKIEVRASGLTTVVGVAFDHRDRMYVLELSDLSGFPSPGYGKLVRVDRSGGTEDIVTGLAVPTAMTVGPDGAIYISNFGAAPAGLGQILRVEVRENRFH